MATAKHRAIDQLRRSTLRRAQARGARPRARDRSRSRPRPTSRPRSDDDDIGDDLLRLVFIACHPVLSTEARVALTLRLLGGLTTDEIARAFLVPEPTIAQRIVRAKRTLAEAHVPFEVPRGDELRRAPGVGARGHLPGLQRGLLGHRRRRLDAPGAVRGRAAPGPHPGRAGARSEPEVHGLVALMEIQASRARGPDRPDRRAGPAARPGPRRAGTSC